MRFPFLSLVAGATEDRLAPAGLSHRARAVACGVVVAIFAAAAPCSAQVRVEFTPFGGAYVPRTDVVSVGGQTCPNSFIGGWWCGGATVRQRNAPILGGQITSWFGNRFGIDFSLGYAFSGMVSQPLPGPALLSGGMAAVGGDTSAHVVMGSARLLVSVTPPMTRTSLYLVAGWSFVTHGGDGYAATVQTFGDPGSTDWGPVLGLGARVELIPLLAPRAELQYYLYDAGPGAAISHFRGDLVYSLGLSVTLSGQRGAAR
jgi:hypothetical protein